MKKERENQRRYDQQLEIERKKAEEAQALIEKMEKEEAELIEKLKTTQKQQEEVCLFCQQPRLCHEEYPFVSFTRYCVGVHEAPAVVRK